MSGLKAIIFDMDGVLVDSMPYHADAWKKVFEEEGIAIERETIYWLEGSNHRGIVISVYQKHGRAASEDDIKRLSEEKKDIFRKIHKLEVFPGVKELLVELKDKYKLAVVSGSDREFVKEIVDTRFPGAFQVVLSGSDVEEGKPSPKPYLLALQKLGVPNDESLVVENSPRGIESAKNAGIKCIAIPTYLPEEGLKDADIVVRDHEELRRYLLENG